MISMMLTTLKLTPSIDHQIESRLLAKWQALMHEGEGTGAEQEIQLADRNPSESGVRSADERLKWASFLIPNSEQE